MRKSFIIIMLLPLFAVAQTPEKQIKDPKFSVGIVPPYAVLNGIRVDFDVKLNDNNHWLVLAPQFYVANDGNVNYDFKNMYGVGLEVQHKIFMKKEKKYRGVYFAYGPTFNYYSVTDYGLGPYEFTENGANYIGLQDTEITTGIYKVGGNAIIGIQSVIADMFYIDPYIGLGVRFSFDDKSSGLHDQYNDWWIDMGYSGTLFVTGVRFGIIF